MRCLALIVCCLMLLAAVPVVAQDDSGLVPVTPENAAHLEQIAQIGQGRFNNVAYSPDGTQIAVETIFGVWLFDAAHLAAEPYFLDSPPSPGSPYGLSSFGWSPDGRFLATTDADHTVIVWDAASHEVVRRIAPDAGAVFWVAWSPDGTRLIFADIGAISIHDAMTAEKLVTMQGVEFGSGQPVWSPDGVYVAATTENHVRVWDATTGKERPLERLQSAAFYAGSVAWSPDGTRLASAGPIDYVSSQIPIWDIQTGSTIRTLELACMAYQAGWSPDGATFAAGCADGTITLWDTDTWEVTRTWASGELPVEFLTWSPAGELLVADAVQMRVWNIASGEQVAVSTPFFWLGANALALSPDDTTLAAATNGQLYLWDTTSGTPTMFPGVRLDYGRSAPHDFKTYSQYDLVWSPDGTRLAVIGWPGGVQVWHVPTAELLFEKEEGSFDRQLWSPDGTEIVHVTWGYMAPHNIQFYDGWTGEATRELDLPSVFFPDSRLRIYGSAILWSPDGTLLSIGNYRYPMGGRPYMWDAVTGEEILLEWPRSCGKLRMPAWSPDGTRLVIVDMDFSSRMYILDAGSGEIQREFEVPWINDLAWSPDGRLLAGTSHRSVQVWDAATGALLVTLEESPRQVSRILWTSDGTRLICGGNDGTVRIWGVPAD